MSNTDKQKLRLNLGKKNHQEFLLRLNGYDFYISRAIRFDGLI